MEACNDIVVLVNVLYSISQTALPLYHQLAAGYNDIVCLIVMFYDRLGVEACALRTSIQLEDFEFLLFTWNSSMRAKMMHYLFLTAAVATNCQIAGCTTSQSDCTHTRAAHSRRFDPLHCTPEHEKHPSCWYVTPTLMSPPVVTTSCTCTSRWKSKN